MKPLTGVIEDDFAFDRRQFKLTVRRLADSLGYGSDNSVFVGSGVDYMQSRIYQPGDPIRAFDWKIYARTRKPHVKEFETTRRIPMWILIDTSASMTIGMHRPSKYVTAVLLAGGVALAALDRMNPVGLLGVGQRSWRLPPTLSTSKVFGALSDLKTYQYGERTYLADQLRNLGHQLREKSIVLVLSDMHDPDAVSSLKEISHQHEVLILQFRDPASRSIKGTGFIRAQEAESGRSFIATRHSQADLQTEEIKRTGAASLIIDIDQDYLPNVRQFLMTREVLKGRGQ